MAEAAKTTVDRDVTGSTTSPVGSSGSGSVPEQAKEKVQEGVEVVQEGVEVVQEKAEELKGTAGERVRREVDARSTEVGTQLQGTATALRRSIEQLRQEGNEVPARALVFVAERTERLGSYLARADADQVLRDAEAFARRQPWLVAAGGAAAGFFAARFLKASSSARYDTASGRAGSRQSWQPQAQPSIDSGSPALAPRPQSGREPVLTAPRGGSNG
jgi:ElaB/YqjD/DUF883 family membrane-anchored ribosome-binding protein